MLKGLGWGRFKPRKERRDVDKALRDLLAQAYRHVPFYSKAWDRAEIRPHQVRGVEDLAKLPATPRRRLMASGTQGFLNTKGRATRTIVRHTTGTTGEPLVVHMSQAENLFRRITLLDTFRRYVPLRPPLTLIDVGPECKDRSTQPVHRMGPVKIIRLFRGMPFDEQIERLMRTAPTILEGRPSPLWELACTLRARGIAPPSPRLIVSYAEMLYPHVRRTLEETFGCRVVDLYNCEEIGNMAWQCPNHPELMHPNSATTWLEAVDEEGSPMPYGEIGRLLATNLYNHTMPFIRYTTGDRGALLAPGQCSCGFHGPRMRLTEGRDENFLVLPDGREISPRLAYDVINAALPHDDPSWSHIEAMQAFQIIQTEPSVVLVKVVPGPAYSDALWPRVRSSVQELHPEMRLQVELVDDLTPEPGKKFHQVLGMLETPWKRARRA